MIDPGAGKAETRPACPPHAAGAPSPTRSATPIDWRIVYAFCPADFRDNGTSSPFRFLYGLIYSANSCAVLAQIARLHDFMYGPGRLHGSPLEGATREQADAMYLAGLLEQFAAPVIRPRTIGDHIHRIDMARMRWVARRHYDVLVRVGGIAWANNARQMAAWGWRTWDDFMRDTDKSYARTTGGAIS